MTFVKTFRRGDSVRLGTLRGTFLRPGYGNLATVEWADGSMSSVDYDLLAHAPVTVVGPVPPRPPATCPRCGNALTVDPDAVKCTPWPGLPPERKAVAVTACGFCDFIKEVVR